MEYVICEYCGKPFLGKNKLQKYHSYCAKNAAKINLKKYMQREDIKDRNNYNSLIRRLNKKEIKYFKKIEIKYITSLIIIKQYSSNFSIDSLKKMDNKVEGLLNMKETIEKEKILNDKKIEFLKNMKLLDLKKRLKELGGEDMGISLIFLDKYLKKDEITSKKISENPTEDKTISKKFKVCRECGELFYSIKTKNGKCLNCNRKLEESLKNLKDFYENLNKKEEINKLS